LRKAVFTFELGPAKNRAVLAALQPEASREIPRAAARAYEDGDRLMLEIEAQDSISLRSAVNSYLRWVKVAAEAADAAVTALQAAPGKAPAPETKGPKGRGEGRRPTVAGKARKGKATAGKGPAGREGPAGRKRKGE